jgi:lysine-specific demethylase/histidyl-hydroxylase NO66
MSRAAKKRLKKKQKAQAVAQEQQLQQQLKTKKGKKKKRRSSEDDNEEMLITRGGSTSTFDGSDEEERRQQKKARKQAKKKTGSREESSKKMNLLESDDDDDDHHQPSDMEQDDEDMRIAEVSRGELDYLESQGVKVTKKKKRKEGKKGDYSHNGGNSDDDSSGRDDDDEAAGTTEGEREEKEILLLLAQNLTPSQVLFPGNDVNDDGDDDAPEEDGAVDPRRILQDLTSTSRARVLFESLLAPSGVTADEFHRSYWEKKPLLVAKSKVSFATEKGDGAGGSSSKAASQSHKTRLENILSKNDIEMMMAKCSLRYGRELNVTRYADAGDGSRTKRRITLDLPPKRVTSKSGKSSNGGEEDLQPVVADPKDVWSNFANGCTIRLLCPHLHSDSVHSLLSTLELEFGCMVGSNAYLTPGGDFQGFAPHYDDVEAFILQLEGRKRWRVYPPPNKAETLPRFSSRDYTEEDMEGTAPVIDTVLGPGDILYMPRGWIHQAHTPPSQGGGGSEGESGHSLHLTASAMQQWAWADLLDIIMPEALEAATASETSTSLRQGLPRNFVNYMGAMYDTSNDDDAPGGLKQADAKRDEMDEDECEELIRQRNMKRMQDKFCEEANKRIMRVCKEAMAMVNAGCDQIGKRFLSDRQPPALTPNEAVLTSEHREENGGKIWPNTMCRLARPGIARLVLEDGKAVLYHCADNSRVYHGAPLSPLEFEVDDAPALEMLLITTEPHWICVKDLIHGDIEDKMEIAQSLYDEGILAILQTDKPDRTVQTG